MIASKFDAARNAQMQLGVMHGLQKEQRVQTAVLEDIRDGRTSNPRRELANQGILWTEESYNSVLRSRDLPAVTLFLAGGMRWRIRDAQPFLNASDDEAAKLFLNYPAQGDQARGCEGLMRSLVRPTNETRTLPPAGQKPHSLSDMERRYLKAFCTQPESRTAAAAMLKQYQQSRQQAFKPAGIRQAGRYKFSQADSGKQAR